MTNAIHLSGLNEQDVWSVAKEIKLKIPLDKRCGPDGLYDNQYAFNEFLEYPDPVTILEQKLKTKRSEQRFDNITRQQLETAGKIIMYLHTCYCMNISAYIAEAIINIIMISYVFRITYEYRKSRACLSNA